VTAPPPFTSPPAFPLRSKTILITRAAGQSSQFTQLLQQQGATVIEMPALEIVPPSSWADLDRAIAELSSFDWLILTSTNGVDYFFERLAAQGKAIQALAEVKIGVVGQKTAASLQQHGLQPDFIPPDFVADSLVEHFPGRDRLAGMKILFPRVETGGREVLVKEFAAQGAEVVEVAAYQSACTRTIAPEIVVALTQGHVDLVTFASSKTVQCFCQLIKALSEVPNGAGQAASCLSETVSVNHLLENLFIASIGPQTSAACEKLLGRVDIEAENYTLEGLTQAIVKWAMHKNT
jgi:uroporphyrinogen-III synthase